MASTSLTTGHAWTSFQADLVKQSQKMAYSADELAKQHRYASDPYAHKQSFSGPFNNSRNDTPDAPALFTGFTMLVAQLRMIVNRIQELEDISDSYDEEDEGELSHSQGELFAHKEMYINIINSYEAVESARIKATEERIPLNNFMRAVCEQGVPTFSSMKNRSAYDLLVDGRITQDKVAYRPAPSYKVPTTPKLRANLAPNPSLTPNPYLQP